MHGSRTVEGVVDVEVRRKVVLINCVSRPHGGSVIQLLSWLILPSNAM